MKVKIDSKLACEFRETAMKKFGSGKGALRKAAEEAIFNWILSEKETPIFEGDPAKAIEGLLKDIDIDSVKLQHETQKLWTEKSET